MLKFRTCRAARQHPLPSSPHWPCRGSSSGLWMAARGQKARRGLGGAGRGRVRAPSAALLEFSDRRVWLGRAGGCGGRSAGPGLKAGVRLPPRRFLTGLVPSQGFQLPLKFKSLIFLAANPVTNRSGFVFPLLPRLDLLCLSYRTIGLRSKCYSGLIPYPGIYFDCPFSLALLSFIRSPFPVKSPLCPPHPVRVSIPRGSVPARCRAGHDALPPRLRDGASPGDPARPGNIREPEMRRRGEEKGLAFNRASPELPAQRLNFSPPAKPLLYPKKNSASEASGGAGRRDPHGPGAGPGGGRGSRGAGGEAAPTAP